MTTGRPYFTERMPTMRNLAKHNRRTLLRHRKNRMSFTSSTPVLWRRLPTGALYRVTQGSTLLPNWHYFTRYGHVYAPFPPAAPTLRELQRWS